MIDLNVEAPFGLGDPGDEDECCWHGRYISVDGTEAGPIELEDVAEVLYQGTTDDRWDGVQGAVVRLKDGRLVAWETWFGPTGSGFHPDAYGGDACVYFAQDLSDLVKSAFSDHTRRLLSIPERLWQ